MLYIHVYIIFLMHHINSVKNSQSVIESKQIITILLIVRKSVKYTPKSNMTVDLKSTCIWCHKSLALQCTSTLIMVGLILLLISLNSSHNIITVPQLIPNTKYTSNIDFNSNIPPDDYPLSVTIAITNINKAVNIDMNALMQPKYIRISNTTIKLPIQQTVFNWDLYSKINNNHFLKRKSMSSLNTTQLLFVPFYTKYVKLEFKSKNETNVPAHSNNYTQENFDNNTIFITLNSLYTN